MGDFCTQGCSWKRGVNLREFFPEYGQAPCYLGGPAQAGWITDLGNIEMYMRVTHYKMKPNAIEAAKAMLGQMKDQIMGMPGMLRFTNSINEDGSGCVVALVESRESSDANQERVAAAWAAFADHLEGAPQAQGFEVFADWQN